MKSIITFFTVQLALLSAHIFVTLCSRQRKVQVDYDGFGNVACVRSIDKRELPEDLGGLPDHVHYQNEVTYALDRYWDFHNNRQHVLVGSSKILYDAESFVDTCVGIKEKDEVVSTTEQGLRQETLVFYTTDDTLTTEIVTESNNSDETKPLN